MKGLVVAGVFLGITATAAVVRAQSHLLVANAFGPASAAPAGARTSANDPAVHQVEGKFVQTYAGGSVDNIAKVDSQTLVLSYELHATQTSGFDVDPREWAAGTSLSEKVIKPVSGAATGIVVRMNTGFSGASSPNGAYPTILNMTAGLAVGTCKISVETNIYPGGSKDPLKELVTCDSEKRRSKLEGDVLVVSVDNLADGEIVQASLGFQPSLGPFDSTISATAKGDLSYQTIGGSVTWESPTFGKASTASSNGPPGGTTSSSSSGGSTTTPSPNNPTTDPNASSGGAAPGAASDDSSCNVGSGGGASVPASFAAIAFGTIAALAMRRRNGRGTNARSCSRGQP